MHALASTHTHTNTIMSAGQLAGHVKYLCRQAGGQAGGQVGRQAGRQTGSQSENSIK